MKRIRGSINKLKREKIVKTIEKIRRRIPARVAAIILLLSLICTSAGIPIVSHAMEPRGEDPKTNFKRVLILNSYDEGYRWTSEQSNAIIQRLKEEFDDILIYVEYMDTKYHPENTNIELLYKLYQYKYSDMKIDLVLTTDNAALEFAIDHRIELFSDAPIVYSGITKKSAAEVLNGVGNVVGVYEVLNPAETMWTAAQINPELERIYMIFDNSQSGLDSTKIIAESLSGSGYELIYLNKLSIDNLLEKVSTLDRNSIILLGPYSTDPNGYRLPADKFSDLISRASSVPVFDLMDYRLGNGIIGGCLLSGSETGRDAAELGVKILKGNPVDRMVPVDKTPVTHIYDYEQLQRFQIPLDRLPEGSKVINKPFSFFETYKYLVIGTAAAFAVLLTLILILIWLAKKRRYAEMAATEANTELKALYEQLYAVDQQLKYQLEELSETHENLSRSEEKYRLVAETANDIIWDWSVENDLVNYSCGLTEILGYETAELMNKEAWDHIVLTEDADRVANGMKESFRKKQDLSSIEYRVRHKDGKAIWISTKAKILFDETGAPHKIVGSHTDITKLKEYQDKIWEMAYYDDLTNLPNRAYLKEYVNDQIQKGTGAASALIYLDIDDFKSINDNFGHKEGDKLLVEVGAILGEITEAEDLVFRQGGDEFVIVFNQINNRDDIMEFVARLDRRLADPIRLTEGDFNVTLSGGIVLYPQDGTDYDTLLKNADIAMYFVKNNGKNGLVFFNEDMMADSREKLLLDRRLRSAVRDMSFFMNYQPIVDIKTGVISKFEALIRWKDPELGLVSPSVFIKRAEENGLIMPIGNWVIRESFLFSKKLASEGYENVTISVNISPIQLRQKDFVNSIKELLDETGAEAEHIEFEITESILIESLESSLNKLNEIRSLKISISLDDFGQGYSSLTYLRMLPINTLKVDKSFIESYNENYRNSQIVCAIIELAHGLGLEVVAEGVETKEQYEFLKESDCDMIQGYLISKPLPMPEAERLISGR